MDINQQDLLNGESLLLSKAANAVIRISDYGLKRLPYDQLMSVVGFKGQEAIGGKLHVTNYRLVFKSHPLNRVTGKFSIFIPTIHSVRDASLMLTKKIEITTQTETLEFVVWGIPSLLQVINSSASALTDEQKTNIRQYAMTNYEKIGDGLTLSKVMNKIGLNPNMVNQVLEIAQDPISLSSVLNLLELLEMFAKEEDE
ncbi:MAG: hypothetical protein U7123_14775 [Potamolinea sp.]